MWKKGNSCTLLVGMQIAEAALRPPRGTAVPAAVPLRGCSPSLLGGSVSPQHCSSRPLYLQPAPWVLGGLLAGGRGSRGAATLWTPGSRACMLLPSRLCALPGCACGFRRHARGPPWRARGPRGGFQGHGAGLGAPGFLGPGARQRCPFQAACPPHHSSAQKAAGNLGQSLLAYPFFVFTYLLLFIKLTIISG